MALSAGSLLGPYEIVAPIGKGGMGEVYRAHDSRLRRDVAIKVSAENFTERFEREARAIAALNHPNICHIYDVGPNYLVMELVDGPTLEERLKAGALPLDEALDVARQIADALEAAHEKGITHRDLKPGNIKVKPDGMVKVLDFGLAKMGGTPATRGDEAATMTMGRTEAGMILGTVAYMSPEQAKGKPVDQRSDIYSFGVVVYEMVTGERLHQGDTTTELLVSVVKEEPQWDKVPLRVRRLLRRCLEKDPQKRLRHIGDVMALVDDDVPVTQAVATPRRNPWAWPATAAIVILGALALAFPDVRGKPAAVAADPVRFEIAAPARSSLTDVLSVSPDGRKIIFLEGGNPPTPLWIRSLDELQPRRLAGTEGAYVLPFWSPDSRYIVFCANGKLQKIEVSGGPPQTICALKDPVEGGFWTRDDKIVFGINAPSGLLEVSAAGGTPSPITIPTASEQRHFLPTLLPDGRHFLYTRAVSSTDGGVYLGSLDAKPDRHGSKKLLPEVTATAYVASSAEQGYLLFVRAGTLMAQPFDNKRLELTGEAKPIAELAGVAAFSASTTGVLAYQVHASAPLQQFTWFDREGRVAGTVAQPATLTGLNSAPALSPDGKRVAFARTDQQSQNTDIWLYDLARGVSTRFTFDPGADLAPVWSPDGSRIAFTAQRDGAWGVYQKSSNLLGGEELLYKSDPVNSSAPPTSWSRDGLLLIQAPAGILGLPMNDGGSGERKPINLLTREFNRRGARFSPDGHFIAYISSETGKDEIYVQTVDASGLPDAQRKGGKWMVSNEGGRGVHWRADGKEIYYLSLKNDMMAVEVSVSSGKEGLQFKAGIPKVLFKSNSASIFWESSPDGKRFLFPVAVGENSPQPYTVVLNWLSTLKK